MQKTRLFRKPWAIISSAVIAFVPFLAAQPAAAVTNFNVTVVASGGAAENTTWSYANGQITPTATVSINASDIVSKLSVGPLVIYSGKIFVNTSISHATANSLTFKATSNIIVGGGLTLQSQGGDIIFNSDSDADNSGHVRMGFDANCAMGNINTNGGDIIVGGGANPRTTTAWAQNADAHSTACLAAGPVAGVALYNYSFNAAGGDISVRGASPTIVNNPSSRGINMNGAGGLTATIQTSGSGTIYFYADGNLILNNTAWGLAVNAPIAVISGSGDITFEGRGNPSGPTNARGVAVGSASTFTSTSGNISFIDRTNGALAGYTGIYFGGAISATTSGNFGVQADEIAQVGALTLDVDNATIGANTTSSFTAVYSTGVINAVNSNSLSIGSPGNNSAVVLGGAITSGGPIGVNAATVTVNSAMTATGSPITFTTTGGVTQNATITASALNLAGTATYSPQSFTVAGGSAQTVFTSTFNTQGGSAVANTVFAAGSPITFSASPLRDGYDFVGWSRTPTGSVVATPFTPGSADITLFAQWIRVSEKTKVVSWRAAIAELGSVVKISLTGVNLDAVQSVVSSNGLARIATKSAEKLEIEITDAKLGTGSVQISSPIQITHLESVFSVLAPPPTKLSTVSSKILFTGNSATLSTSAQRKLLAALKQVVDPSSIVIYGSVAAQKSTAATKALALQRAKVVAGLVARVFPKVASVVSTAATKGNAASNHNAVITIKFLSKK